MKRLLYKELLNWKEGKDRKHLILNGARQVGNLQSASYRLAEICVVAEKNGIK